MSKINEILLKLESFNYTTSLYFKEVYYHIRLLQDSKVTYVRLLSHGENTITRITNGS